MVDSDLGLTLVFNGCIYNYQELRASSKAAAMRSSPTADSEVVIKAFHRWGVRCVDHFKGMFAFAIADRDHRRRHAGARPARHQAALPGRGARAGCASRRPCGRC